MLSCLKRPKKPAEERKEKKKKIEFKSYIGTRAKDLNNLRQPKTFIQMHRCNGPRRHGSKLVDIHVTQAANGGHINGFGRPPKPEMQKNSNEVVELFHTQGFQGMHYIEHPQKKNM